MAGLHHLHRPLCGRRRDGGGAHQSRFGALAPRKNRTYGGRRNEMIASTVLHSVSYAGLWGQPFLPIGDFIDKAAELGFDAVELMAKRPHLSVLGSFPSMLAALRARLDQRKIRCACIAGYTNFTADMEHGDIPQREMQIGHVARLAEIASELGCNLVRVFTGYDTPAAPYARQWTA